MARTEVTGKQIKDQSVDLAVDVTGVLPVASGGSGSNTLALNNVLLGNGTGALQAVAPGTSGNVLTSNGSTWVSSAPTGGGGVGDVTTNTTTSVDSEIVLFSGTTGKALKRATGTGWAYVTAGVLSTATPTKADVGLGNVDNTSDANKPISTATQTALDGKEPSVTAGTTSQYYRGDKSWQTLNKTAVGLSNVDNTSDADKPVSTATQSALDGKLSTTGTAAAATKLATSRTFIADLGGTGSASFDGTANATLGVTGSLPQSSVSGLTTDLAGKEPTITAGTTSQYWRGDKSWQTLNVAAVSGAEATVNKGVANGYASLNSSGVIPLTQQTYAVLDGGTSSSAGADVINGGTPVSA